MDEPVTARPHGAAASPALRPEWIQVGSRGGSTGDASRQLRALALLSGSLTDPLTPTDAAEVIEQQALAVLGATSAVVMTLGDFPPVPVFDAPGEGGPQQLSLLHAVGLPSDVASVLQRVPLDAEMPLAEVARTGEAIFLNSEVELRRYPGWCDQLLATGSRAAAAVPVWANGHLRGVLGLTWEVPHTFDDDERAFVLTLGVMCAQAIMRGHLKAAEVRARELAEQANLAKTQFLRMVSHELRTPLTAVVGYTELLEDEVIGPMTELQRDHLRRIRRSSDHLLSLIEELLTYAQVEAGEQVLRIRGVRLADVAEEMHDIVRPMAAVKDIAILIETPDQSLEIETDGVKLRQILVNLVTNAVKYSDKGEVRVVVQQTVILDVAHIVFAVTDLGHGITAEHQARIFEPFWQVDQSLTRKAGGTGLGLAVARQLARLLGGELVVAESVVGRGSTFELTLPVHYMGAAPVVVEAA